MKKSIIFLLLLVTIISSLSVVSAGLFDFGSDTPELVNQDFGDFTMDVPSDLILNESTALNGKDVLENAVAENGGTISFDELDSNPKYNHPIWEDENSTITIEYIDCKEDQISDADEGVIQNYADAVFMDEADGISTYNMSDVYSGISNETFAVAKENPGNSVIIIIGQDKDLITEMANSIEFK